MWRKEGKEDTRKKLIRQQARKERRRLETRPNELREQGIKEVKEDTKSKIR